MLLSKSAQSVQAALEEKGITSRVVELAASTRTAQDAVAAIGCDVAQIVKSLIFKTRMSQKPVLVLASGPNRVNEKHIESLVGESIVKADADFTRKVTGFAIGGIPPFGHKQAIELIFIDEDLLNFEDVWAAAGTPHAVFCLKGKDLREMTKGKVVSVQ
ncbi:MAG: YbaK/EbsC family protein [Alphaproteobacteria bacterium]|nr:YbaK/EbsC family protein [Alphaproteobacteria bacterium]